MGNITEPPAGPHTARQNPLQAHERFHQQLRDLGRKILDSDEGAQIIRFKRELVLDLFLRRGGFWDEIQAMRKRWNIEASKQLVEPGVWCPYPVDPRGWAERDQWIREINALWNRTIPQRYLNRSVDWHRFIPACILYDPPDDELIDFAYFAGPTPTTPLPVSPEQQEAMGDDWNLSMIAPPIVSLADASEVRSAEIWFYRTMLDRIGEDYLKPRGIDIWELFEKVWKSSRDLWAKRSELESSNSPKLYIKVEEWTTENDVRNAFRLICQTQPARRKRSKPTVDPLLAVQCAILHDRHNGPLAADGRRRKWAYERLKEVFDLKSSRAAKAHVETGRRILKNSRVQ